MTTAGVADEQSCPRLLELRGVEKRFGNTRALRGVDFDLVSGEVHALLGENGSGKSTLMKVAYGEVSPSSGRVFVDGSERHFATPHAALLAGIAAVPQEVPLVNSLSVAENILLGRLPRRGPRVAWSSARRRARDVLQLLEVELAIEREAGTLRPSERQLVAIARALAVEARILIFDEPTSSLTANQAGRLFEIIRRLKTRGVGIVFISQRLQDVQEVSDRVTVMRDGLVAGILPAIEASHDRITELMIGRSLTEFFHKHVRPPGEVLLEARGLRAAGAFEDVSFTVRAGEVLGLAGLVGCGRVELLRSIFGADRQSQGSISLSGREYRPRDPATAVAAGIGMVTADRKTEGLVLSATVQENITMVRHRRISLRPLPRLADRRWTLELVQRLRIQTAGQGAPAQSLSGGNQQKVVLAKWLGLKIALLLLDEPTRGVDVGAKAEIYRIISDLADSGVALVVSSSENAELLGICDRILVFDRGRIAGELAASTTNERELADLSAGVGRARGNGAPRDASPG